MSFPKRTIPLTWLTGLFLLNFLLKLPFIGHFLTWDEAWILCSLKEFVKGNQIFSLQLWKHPPLYMGLGLLLSPAEPGFDTRMAILSLMISSGALIFFTIIFSKLYGRRTALLAGLIYTVLPGTLFFDTWIKRDGLVTLFCALTLFALIKKKDILAGIFFGLCLLSKETAIFFAFGFLAIIVLHRPPHLVRRSLFFFWGITVALSSWWYLLFDSHSDNYFAFFQGASSEASGFAEPWWYYLAKLRIDLGWPGLLLLLIGTGTVLYDCFLRKRNKITLNQFKKYRLLPVFMIGPGYLVISLSHGKPFWITISFSPFLALLIAFGSLFLFKLISQALSGFKGKALFNNRWVPLPLLIGLLAANTFPFSYGSHFKKMSPTRAQLILNSYEMSDVVNTNVQEHEKLLILPMIFRSDPTYGDPIFHWNAKPVDTLYFKGTQLDFEKFQEIIPEKKIKWALIFPLEGSWEEDLFRQVVSKTNPTGYKFSTGYLLKVDSYWKSSQE
jgi:4-amino-4-deoxy-L-arabinose transferase-like glycosyltransferase